MSTDDERDAGAPEGSRQSSSSFMRSAVLTYGTNLTTAFLSLVNVLIIARALGPTGRGDVAFLITVATMTALVGGLSVQEANGNIAGTDPGLRRRLAGNSVVLALGLGAVSAGVVAGLVAIFPAVGGEVDRALLWVALGCLPILMLRESLKFLVQADYAFAITNVAWLAGPTTTFLVNGLSALLGVMTEGTAFAVWIGGQTLGLLVLAGYVARHEGFGRPHLPTLRRTVAFAAKAHPTKFMSVGNYRADQWFVGSIAGSRELGIYSVAVAWAEMLYYLPGVLVMIQRPDLVRATREHAARFAAQVFRVAILLGTIMALGLIVLAPVLCVWVFGEEFRGAVDDLRILALAAFGIVAIELLASALIAQRQPLRATAAVAVAFATTVALNFALIPGLGSEGAAISRLVAYSAGGVAVALIFTRTLQGHLRDLVPRGTEIPWFLTKVRGRLSRA